MKSKLKSLLASVLMVMLASPVFAQLTVTALRCAYQARPISVDAEHPQLSWELQSVQRNCMQTAYRIIVADDIALLKNDKGNIWDSKKVLSDSSVQVSFAGKKLQAAKLYYWKIKAWDNHGRESAWSAPAQWQMGLLAPGDWKDAKWIAYEKMPDSLRIVPALESPADKRWNKGNDVLPLLRKDFTLQKQVKKATIYITGLGQFDLHINGKKVGDHFLDPGWTQYSKHAQYVAFDITSYLKQGNNAVGVMLGNGFYYIPGDRYHKLKGAYGYPKMICRAIVEYTDGSRKDIVSNDTWKAAPGPVTYSSIYGGEDFDATRAQQGWDLPGFSSKAFRPAVPVDGPPRLEAQGQSPLKVLDQFDVKKISQPKPGVWVYDMGQNASAIPFISVKGAKGAVVKITPAELLDDKGLVLQAPVGAPVYFNYTLNGQGTESWQPQFMYYGFRYVQIEGAAPQGKANKGNLPVIVGLKSRHVRNSATSIGSFTSSNDLFNKTFKLIDWAIRSNTVSIFTDCPHREKLGWLEEAHLVGSSIRYNYDIATLCRKVINDMRNSQTADGLIPDIAPEYVEFTGGFRDSPEWGSNGIIMPYYVYQWYGDKAVLTESYDMMTRYAAYLGKRAKDHILYFGLGDWYDIGPRDLGPSQLTPGGITSTAIYYYDLTLLAKTAHILHKYDDERRYLALSAEVKAAYNKTFYKEASGQYGTGSQTANAISMYMGLVDESQKPKVLANLIADIRKHGNAITAGDIGYRYLLRVLDDAGRSDVIFDMNSRSDVPGYGYQIAQGATSLTESWQGNRISSNNHFMLGHLMEWFYSGLGGLKADTTATAFRQLIIRPEVVGDVTSCKVSYRSPYGMVANDWSKKNGSFKMNITLPVNAGGIVYLPAEQSSTITEGGKPLALQKGIELLRYESGRALVKVGSGAYSFEVVN